MTTAIPTTAMSLTLITRIITPIIHTTITPIILIGGPIFQ